MTEQDKQALIKHFCSRDCGEAAEGCTIMPCHEIELIQEFPASEADSDTISRQAAIDGKICIQRANGVEIYDDYVVPVEYLEQLPPAQPSTGDCWGCNCPKMERLAQPEPSKVVKDIARIVENGKDMRVIAQGRIRGRWIIRETSSGDTEARCSHCGFTTLVDEPGNGLHMVSDLNFCPNCGADMGEVTT